MSAPRLEAPIVLAHGLLGFSRIEVGGYTLASYFKAIPEQLEAGGNVVFQAAVPPTGSIASRAERLKEEILGSIEDELCHIIAHSMGGLDARHMITHLDMADQVLSLTTLGTPHRGTPFADRGVKFAKSAGIMTFATRLGVVADAFHDLRTEDCAKFNEATPDVDSVRYFSVAGEKKREEMFYPLRFSQDVIADSEGANDGLVSSCSARWGESFTVWDSDHLNMVGWVGPRESLGGYGFDVEGGYGEIVERLVGCGF